MKLTFLAGASALALCIAAGDAAATPTILSYTGAIQTFTVPTTGEYTILADGAQGGDSFLSTVSGGLGAEVSGDYFLTAGTVLDVVVGGMGGFPGAGGGGSFVYTSLNALMLAAGGGGGAGTNGNPSVSSGGPGLAGQDGGAGTGGSAGAGGTSGGGGTGGQRPNPGARGGGGGGGWAGDGGAGSSGGAGGLGFPDFTGGNSNTGGGAGGFGGGGGAGFGPIGGGGGGYSGGGGGGDTGAGGGGGSFISADATNTVALGGQNSGNGLVSFDLHDVPEPGSALLILSALTGLGVLRRKRR